MLQEVVIIDTGVANNASVCAALSRLGVSSRLSTLEADVRNAPALVLPGVGSFGAGGALLAASGLIEALRERVEAGRATLCVCLGMQLLFERSEESPGARGIGVVEGEITAYPEHVARPQFGWNMVRCGAVDADGYAYFANSYRCTQAPAGWAVSWSDHGGPFVAAMRRGGVLACQFHPELSGAFGLSIMRDWLAMSEMEVPC